MKPANPAINVKLLQTLYGLQHAVKFVEIAKTAAAEVDTVLELDLEEMHTRLVEWRDTAKTWKKEEQEEKDMSGFSNRKGEE